MPQPAPPVSPALEGLAAGGAPPRPPRAGEDPATALGEAAARRARVERLLAWIRAAAPGEQRREAATRAALSVTHHTTALNLFDLGLRTLPPHLHAFTHLRSMVVSGNHLAGPFDRRALPPLLEHLAMMRSEVAVAPDFQDLTQLSVLMFDQNFLTVAPVVRMPTMRILSLSNNQLRVPPEVHLLPNLEALSLDNNLLVAMPDVRGLPNLLILDLRGNRMTTLPPWIVDLPRSMNIQLDGNPLGENVICSLTKTRNEYKASEHAKFDQMLHDIVGSNVGTSLADLEARLRGGVRAAVAASNARDRAWAEGDSARRAAQDDEATRRVQANARGPERVSNGVPSAVSSIASRRRLTPAQEQEMRKLLNLTPSQPLPRERSIARLIVERRSEEARHWSDSIRDLEQRLATLRRNDGPAQSRRGSVSGQSISSEDLERRYAALRAPRSDSVTTAEIEQRLADLRGPGAVRYTATTEEVEAALSRLRETGPTSGAGDISITSQELERFRDLQGPNPPQYTATTEQVEAALSRLRETDINGERITTEYIAERLDRLRGVDPDLIAQLTQRVTALRDGAESLFVPPPQFDPTQEVMDPNARRLANMQGTGEGVASLLPPVPAQRSGERRRQT